MSGGGKDYEVGYGKPPKHSRFKPGQSGNLKGRPPKSHMDSAPITENAVDDILRRELGRKLRVKDGTGTCELTALEVAVRSQIQSAAKGNALAQRDLIRTAAELEQRDAERAHAEHARKQEDYGLSVWWKQHRAKLWERARQEGQEPDQPWPHPDDILLDEATLSWRVRGPSRLEDLPYYEYLNAMRDLHLLQSSLVGRSQNRKARQQVELYHLLWQTYDLQLPKRWQIQGDPSRLLLSIEMMDMRKLKRLIRTCEVDNRHWHKQVFPMGESIRLNDDIRSIVRPHLKRLGYRSFSEFERHLNAEYGNAKPS